MPRATRASRPRLAPLALLLSIVLTIIASSARAQVPADDSIAGRVRAGGTRYATPRAVLWVEPGSLADAEARRFALALDTALAEASRLLGRTLDAAHYDDDTVQVFVARGVGVSHVYGGYAHQSYTKPWLFLDPAKVLDGTAPYVHEATHLLAPRFGSHSLREGTASLVEATLVERGVARTTGLFGIGSARAADDRARALLADTAGPTALEVLPHIGRGGMPDARVTSPERPRSRAAYYVLAQSFAQHVARGAGMAALLRVYEAEDAEAAYERETGHSLAWWRSDWMRSLAAR